MHMGFNRDIVECKDLSSPTIQKWHTVVLIETQWNVKMLLWRYSTGKRPGFNRDIVECKDLYISILGDVYQVLIETQWNVKRAMFGLLFFVNQVLIETQWNVKTSWCVSLLKTVKVLIETQWNVKKDTFTPKWIKDWF